MTTLSHTVRDSVTMLRRDLRRARRYPVTAAVVVGLPVVLLLLFVGVFGETMGAGLVGATGGRVDYLTYITPGILLIAIAGAAQGAAISVAMDMSEGIIDRFRTMAISRTSILGGHVLGNLLQTMSGLVLVLLVAVGLGFRPTAGPLGWLGVAGLLTGTSLAVIWVSVALGLAAKTVESASNTPMPLMLLPFLGSGFVPTDAMPGAVAWFARYQPFTPIMETLRALLLGDPVGLDGLVAAAWIVGIGVTGWLASRRLFDRERTP